MQLMKRAVDEQRSEAGRSMRGEEVEFSNPLPDAAVSGGHDEEVRPDTELQGDVDTDAVMSPTARDLPLSAIGCFIWGNVVTKPVVGVLLVYNMFVYSFFGFRSGHANPSSLMALMDFATILGLPLCVLSTGLSLSKVANGRLEDLGAGKVKISVESLRSIKRAQLMLLLPTFVTSLVALVTFYTAAFKVGEKSKLSGNVITPQYVSINRCICVEHD